MTVPELPTRPDAEVYTVSDLLKHARTGRLRVPRFQAGLRWQAEDVAALFDSIYRGFPVGSLLLWKRRADAEHTSFGPVEVEAPELSDALHVVDGQQRITALVGALLHPDDQPTGGAHAIWLNLATLDFRVQRTVASPPWIPLRLLGDRRRLVHWAAAPDVGRENGHLVDRAFALEERIVRYSIPVHVVDEDDPATLRLILRRTNTAGAALKEEDVFQALLGGDGDDPNPFDEMAGWLDGETGFGKLRAIWLLRCLRAVGGVDPRRAFTEQDRPPEKLLSETRQALRSAAQFLQESALLPHAKVLPYRFPLIILSRFFHFHPSPHPRSIELLKRWVWRGALAGVHGDNNEVTIVAHLSDIGEDEHGAVQSLLKRVPKRCDDIDPHATWDEASVATRLTAASLFTLEPLDPRDERPWSRSALLRELSERDLGELFPRVGEDEREIAAAVLLPRGCSPRVLDGASAETMRSLGIDEESAVALRRHDDAAFVASRARHLTTVLESVAERMAAPDESDRPPMQALLSAS